MRTDIPWLAVQMGTVAGMRAATPHAMLALARHDWGASPLQLGFSAMALAELVGDKLPFTPLRTLPLPLAGRAVSGALAGYAIARRARVPPLLATVLGASAAIASSYAFSRLRQAATGERGGLAKLLSALVEDAAALALARRVALSVP